MAKGINTRTLVISPEYTFEYKWVYPAKTYTYNTQHSRTYDVYVVSAGLDAGAVVDVSPQLHLETGAYVKYVTTYQLQQSEIKHVATNAATGDITVIIAEEYLATYDLYIDNTLYSTDTAFRDYFYTPTVAPTKEGYIFLGYYDNVGTTLYQINEKIDMTKADEEGNFYLYSAWQKADDPDIPVNPPVDPDPDDPDPDDPEKPHIHSYYYISNGDLTHIGICSCGNKVVGKCNCGVLNRCDKCKYFFDTVRANELFSNVNTGITLDTENTETDKYINIHINYLDVVKLNNPSNIKAGSRLFGIYGSSYNSATPTPQAGIVIHDIDATTIIPFFGSSSYLNNLTWSVDSQTVEFSNGTSYRFKADTTKVTPALGTLTYGQSSSSLQPDQIKEYTVTYRDAQGSIVKPEPQKITLVIIDGTEYYSTIPDPILYLGAGEGGNSSAVYIKSASDTSLEEMLKSNAAGDFGLSVDNDDNVTSEGDLNYCGEMRLIFGSTYTFYSVMIY